MNRITLCIFWLFKLINQLNAQSKCDVIVNKSAYKGDRLLYSSNNYEIVFGLPINNKSVPIGYSIDIECSTKNSTKLKTSISFDLRKEIKRTNIDIPIEVNTYSCNGGLFIRNLNFSDNKRNDFLGFKAEFTGKNISYNITMALSLNRRLGDGCSRVITFQPKNKDRIFDFEDFFGEHGAVFGSLKDKFNLFWSQVNSNPVCLFLLSVIVVIMSSLFLCVFVYCIKKSYDNNKHRFNVNKGADRPAANSSPQQNNQLEMRKEKVNETFTDIAKVENANQTSSFMDETRPCSSRQKMSSIGKSKTPNEFQILRQQLMNGFVSNEEYEKNFRVDCDMKKNLIFQS